MRSEHPCRQVWRREVTVVLDANVGAIAVLIEHGVANREKITQVLALTRVAKPVCEAADRVIAFPARVGEAGAARLHPARQ
jgi:hypothetical protein